MTPADTTEQIIDNLARSIVARQCVLFVGPDLSESSYPFRGVPTSWQLAAELADLAGYEGRFRALPRIAQIFQSGTNDHHLNRRGQLIDFLLERVAAPEFRPLPIHNLIAKIDFHIIVSGAWDTLLEEAIKDHGLDYLVVRTNAEARFIDDQKGVIFKPFGSVDNPDTLVVTEQDQQDAFTNISPVFLQLSSRMQNRDLVLVGYAPAQDGVFVKVFYDIRRDPPGPGGERHGSFNRSAYAVQSLVRQEDAANWRAFDVNPVITDPVTFMRGLAEAVASLRGQESALPDLNELSDAPRLTHPEIEGASKEFDRAMRNFGVADLVEEVDIPLLSEDQQREIEVIQQAYQRLTGGFSAQQTPARASLLLGNFQYARQNYASAESYYQRALESDPNLAEAYHNLHYTRLAAYQPELAMEAYHKSLAINEDLTILPRRYRIQAILGSGGLGVVYRVCDEREGRAAAVKVLARYRARTDRVLDTFEREWHILSALRHPNIVHPLEKGNHRGNHYIVMECLEGKTLREALEGSGKPFELKQAYDLAEQICRGLQYAHQANVVHRDVKPSNILLVDGQAKLIDFGLARHMDAGLSSTTGLTSGTAAYMAPEQLEGRFDRRTDVYAVATVFYEMVVGSHPAQGVYRPIKEHRRELSAALSLDLVIEKARERFPGDRHQTVEEFWASLQRVRDRQKNWYYRLAAGVEIATCRAWPWLLGAALALGFLVPEIIGDVNAVPSYSARVASIFVILALVLALPTDWFTAPIARRFRSDAIAAYGGRFIGVLLAGACGVLLLAALDIEQGLGTVGPQDFLLVLITFVATTLVIALVVSVTMWGMGSLTHRLNGRYTRGFFLAYGMCMIGLVVGAIVLLRTGEGLFRF